MKHRSIFHKSILVLENQLSPQFCSHTINKFEEPQSEKKAGFTASGQALGVKQSTDLMISFGEGSENWKAEDRVFSESLSSALIKYRQHMDKVLPGIHIDGELFDVGHQMQRTCPGGYYHWHNDSSDSRQLTYIWYLNDVNGGGGYTEFCDGTKVYPKAGRMLIFPANFVYVHRGVTPKKDLKYIVTGWVYQRLSGCSLVLDNSGIDLREHNQHANENNNDDIQLDCNGTTEIP